MGLLVKTVRGENTKRAPFWFMRQAGRYLPEYREIRARYPNFFACSQDVQAVTRITLQPVERLDTDAAIIFADILTLPISLGFDIRFEQGEGPKSYWGKEKLPEKKNDNAAIRENVYRSQQNVKTELSADKDLIGFAGAPWTVLCYLFGGRKANEFETAREALYTNPQLVQDVIDYLTESTIDYLSGQIESGASLVMFFDSWAGLIPETHFKPLLIDPIKKITAGIKTKHPDVPIIGFPRSTHYSHVEYAEQTGIDVLSIDQFTPLAEIKKKFGAARTLQGNLDPLLVKYNQEKTLERAEQILTEMKGRKFIFNLGHGFVPETPVENVEALSRMLKAGA